MTNNFNNIVEEVNREIINNSLVHQEGEPILSIDVHQYIQESLNEEDKLAFSIIIEVTYRKIWDVLLIA